MVKINKALIKQLRKEQGLTQGELADKVGITQSAINKFERGFAEPSLQTLGRIAKVLGTDAKSLLKWFKEVWKNGVFQDLFAMRSDPWPKRKMHLQGWWKESQRWGKNETNGKFYKITLGECKK